MDQVRLPNTKDEKYSMVAIPVELGREYKVTVFGYGSYIGTIDEITDSSVVVTGIKPLGKAPAITIFTVHNKDKAIFPTEEIYDIESV